MSDVPEPPGPPPEAPARTRLPDFRPAELKAPEPPPPPPRKKIPNDVTALFMALAVIGVIFPLLACENLEHCPNDASRWNTIYYLLEHGTYEFKPDWQVPWRSKRGKSAGELSAEQKERMFKIGELYYDKPSDMPPFWTIDLIKIGDKYYSSKPPLLPTCLAGLAWALEKATGWGFRDHPRFVMRATVILAQIVPFVIFIWLMRHHVNRQSDSAFVRNLCIGAAALATYLTPYLITLNNHVIAACTAMFALHAAIRIWYDGKRARYCFAIAGFFAALTAGLELPAALLAAALLLVLLIKAPNRTLTVALPAALVPVIAFFVTNYLAVGSMRPAYMDCGVADGVYDFAGSYWMPHRLPGDEYWPGPPGVDGLSEPKPVYLIHLLIGHHGFFLLTPIFMVSLFGIFVHWFRRDDRSRPLLATLVLLLTGAIVAVYTVKTNNYGGGCQGPRWLFWLIPLWLLMLPAGVDLLARARIGRMLCFLLVFVSLVSVAWAMPQIDDHAKSIVRPWSDSWAHELFRHWQWIDY